MSEKVDAVLRSQVLAERYGLRRDKLNDIFVRWHKNPEAAKPVEVYLSFIGLAEGALPLHAWLVRANATEYTVADRNGRHWAVDRNRWELTETVKSET